MKILHRYLLSLFIKNLALSLLAFTVLFLVIDFFDHIDNILPQDPPLLTVIAYFLFKIPQIVSYMLPVSMIISVLFTIGILSKNSEITAMRASGVTISYIARPLYITGLVGSLFAIVLNETTVPYAARRTRELYAIDILKKDSEGAYNQNNFWWRMGNSFYSAGLFDSRNNTLYDLSRFDISDTFEVMRRLDAKRTHYLASNLGWSMHQVAEYHFLKSKTEVNFNPGNEPLAIESVPTDFYDMQTDPATLSFAQLKRFIRDQASNGISTRAYIADLYEKLSSPFLVFLVVPLVLPFALKSARSGSLAWSFVAALIIGFSYYAVHSLSLALGRAEIWPPFLAAWMANIIFGTIGLILTLGAEAPN